MKASWLRWINNEYDNTVEFLAAGRRQGVFLPVTLKDLKVLSWKDDIYCMKATPPRKAGSVFCRLTVSRLSGLSEEVWDLLREEFPTVVLTTATCNCRKEASGESYLVGSVCNVMATIQEIADFLEGETKKGTPVGKLLIGCESAELETLRPPWGVMAEVNKFKGFMQFSAYRFNADLGNVRIGKKFDKRLYGQYFAEVKLSNAEPGEVEWINRYEELDIESGPRQVEFNFASK